MSQRNILEVAKQGNPEAIATLINRSLQPKGITAKVSLKDGCLQVLLKSAQIPDQQALVPFIRKGLTTLGVPSVKRVKVYGSQLEEDIPTWDEEFELRVPDLVPSTDTIRPLSAPQPKVSEPRPVNPPRSNTLANARRIPKTTSQRVQNQNNELVNKVLSIPGLIKEPKNLMGMFMIGGLLVVSSIFAVVKILTPVQATVSGSAWITKKAGQSDIQRGLEVVLCSDSVRPKLKQVRDEKWNASPSQYSNDDLFKQVDGYRHLDLDVMNQVAVTNDECFKTTKTDVNGKYTFSNVQKGSYILYAPYESSFSKAYWLVPFEVKNSKPVEIDLENSNAEEIYNEPD